MRHFVFCSIVLITALPLSSAAAASGPSNGTIVINFAVVPGKPLLLHQRPQYSFKLFAAPGQVVHDVVAVANGSKTTPLTVRLNVSDAVTPPRGAGLSFVDSGAQHQIGRWTQLNAITVTVSPNDATLVPITMRVPSTARPGEYEGSFSATTVSGYDVTQQGHTHTVLHFTKRCLVYLRVAGSTVAGLKVMRTGFMNVPKRPAILAITLKNTGTLIDQPRASTMTFTGMQKTYTLHPLIGTLLGGASTIIGFDLSRAVPAGTYRVRIAISYVVQPTYSGPYRQLQTTWSGRVVVPK